MLNVLPSNEKVTRGTRKLRELAHSRQDKHTSTVLERSITFSRVFKVVDAEDITNRIKPFWILHQSLIEVSLIPR